MGDNRFDYRKTCVSFQKLVKYLLTNTNRIVQKNAPYATFEGVQQGCLIFRSFVLARTSLACRQALAKGQNPLNQKIPPAPLQANGDI